MQASKDVWADVCWRLVEGKSRRPKHDTCEWRLPWAQLLVDVGNLSCVCTAARDGCGDAMWKAAALIRCKLPREEVEANRALQPVLAGAPFALPAVRRLLPFTAASRAKLRERLQDHLFLRRATSMPIEILEARRAEGSREVSARRAAFLQELHKLGDPTAIKLLRFDWSPYLRGCAFHVVPELRLKFGTSRHGWRYAKRLGKQLKYERADQRADQYADDTTRCQCARCRWPP